MSLANCQTCIHWVPWDLIEEGQTPVDPEGHPVSTYVDREKVDNPQVWGTCGLIVHPQTADRVRDVPAFTMDSSDYWGRLNCREDFGCTLHEVREPAGALATPPPPGSPGGPPEIEEDEETVDLMSAASPDPISTRRVRVPRLKDHSKPSRPRLPDGLGVANAKEAEK